MGRGAMTQLRRCYWQYVASGIHGVGVVQESLRLLAGADFLPFKFVPSLDCTGVRVADFSVAEGVVAPVDALSACGCGVQKNGVV